MKDGLGFIFIRTKLFNGIYTDRVKESFEETYIELKKGKAPFYEFMLAVMDEANNELKNGELLMAGYDINLLHNLPETVYNSWNEEYFYSMTLLDYMENMSEHKRLDKIKRVIDLISTHLTKNTFNNHR